jgi:molecular chaperone GrpE
MDANPVDPERIVSGGSEESEPTGPKVTDKRRLDPETGEVRHPVPGAETGQGDVTPQADEGLAADAFEALGIPEVSEADVDLAKSDDINALLDSVDVHPDTTLAADLTRDLQRLQAEYVNYKKRVDRDRAVHRDLAVASVIESLLPVLDDIHLARQHGDLDGGPFAAIADKLDGTLTKIGVERFGQPGDPFDPTVHEALMHIEAELAEGTQGTTVVQVLQPGYRKAQRIIRPARVAVADPPI